MKNKLKELISQAEILAGKGTTEGIAEYLAENNVVALPVGVGDKVWFLVAKGRYGTLFTSGVPAERTVDAVIYDGKRFEIHSKENPYDDIGNLYAYWNEKVFMTKEEAQKALDAMWEKNGR